MGVFCPPSVIILKKKVNLQWNDSKRVIRFSGDSGDGMQLTDTVFEHFSFNGNDLATFRLSRN